ncbi:MAG: holdfast anchoring protein HfaA [Asticcacaulis sp.]
MRTPFIAAALMVGAAPAAAQTSDLRTLENGYGNGRRLENQPFAPTTRDADGNRLIVNGVIQYGDANSTYSQSSASTGSLLSNLTGTATQGTSSATAVGNLLSVTVTGSHNTIVLNSRQDNSGEVSAVLNGRKTTGQ